MEQVPPGHAFGGALEFWNGERQAPVVVNGAFSAYSCRRARGSLSFATHPTLAPCGRLRDEYIYNRFHWCEMSRTALTGLFVLALLVTISCESRDRHGSPDATAKSPDGEHGSYEEQVNLRENFRLLLAEMSDLKSGIEGWRAAHGAYPPAHDYPALGEMLVPEFLEEGFFPDTDPWGTPYAYINSEDGASYRLISAGIDGRFEGRSSDWSYAGLANHELYDYDIIIENGQSIQYPISPKMPTPPSM
jgi:hypothetical protein